MQAFLRKLFHMTQPLTFQDCKKSCTVKIRWKISHLPSSVWKSTKMLYIPGQKYLIVTKGRKNSWNFVYILVNTEDLFNLTNFLTLWFCRKFDYFYLKTFTLHRNFVIETFELLQTQWVYIRKGDWGSGGWPTLYVSWMASVYAQPPANFPAKQRSLIFPIYQHAWHSMVDI